MCLHSSVLFKQRLQLNGTILFCKNSEKKKKAFRSIYYGLSLWLSTCWTFYGAAFRNNNSTSNVCLVLVPHNPQLQSLLRSVQVLSSDAELYFLWRDTFRSISQNLCLESAVDSVWASCGYFWVWSDLADPQTQPLPAWVLMRDTDFSYMTGGFRAVLVLSHRQAWENGCWTRPKHPLLD